MTIPDFLVCDPPRCTNCHKAKIFDHVPLPLPIPPYTKQYSLLLNAADASLDGIDLLINVGNLPPTPGVQNTTINCHVHVPTMMMHQTHGPPPVALLLHFLGVTYVNTSWHTAPLHHPSRVKASIAIVGFDLADLHSHLPQKSTFFNTKYTWISIIINGYA